MFSEKGRTLRVVDGYKFRLHKSMAHGVQKWVYTVRSYSAFMKIGSSSVVLGSSWMEHVHRVCFDQLTKEALSNRIERRAVEDMLQVAENHSQHHSERIDRKYHANLYKTDAKEHPSRLFQCKAEAAENI